MRERERAGDRDRRHRAGERERRDDQQLARGREIDDAVGHRDVELQRRIGVDDGVGVRARTEFLRRNAVREANEFEIVGHLAVAAGKYERNLVAEHQLRPRHLQMADMHRYVLRFGRAAEHVNDFEALAQLDEIAKILERAGAPAARRVHDVGRSRGGRECDATVRQGDMALRVDGMQRHIARCARERARHQIAAEAHDLRRLVDLGAGVAISDARIRRQHLHALCFEHLQRGLVNGRDLIVGEHLQRLERIAQMPVGLRAVEYGVTDLGGSGPAPAAPAERLIGWFHADAALQWVGKRRLAPIIRKMPMSGAGARRQKPGAAIDFLDMPMRYRRAAPLALNRAAHPRGRRTGARWRSNAPPPPPDNPSRRRPAPAFQ